MNTCDSLIIGADSAIGTMLFQDLKQSGIDVMGTSRRAKTDYCFLDLAQAMDLETLPLAKTVYLCAGITGFDGCDAHPSRTLYVNGYSLVLIGEYYLKKGSHVIFLSTSAVFGDIEGAPNESEDGSPNSLYGTSKYIAEIALKTFTQSNDSVGILSIVRLSKVLCKETPLLKQWMSKNAAGDEIKAFENYYMSPISAFYVTNALIYIAKERLEGILHLSGSTPISYLEFAQILKSSGLISPEVKITSSLRVTESAKTQCFMLGMERTEQVSKLKPQTIASVVNELIQ
jgi:dTDP-4-dehydrorhamnose reductase